MSDEQLAQHRIDVHCSGLARNDLDGPPPFPEGWTLERYAHTAWDNDTVRSKTLEAMSHEEIDLIMDYIAWASRCQQADQPESSPDEGDKRLAVKYDFESYWDGNSYGEFPELATVMDKHDVNLFGFVVFKTWGYRGEAEQSRWREFWERWLEYFEEVLQTMGATGDVRTEGLASKLTWHFVEDPALEGNSIEQIRQLFEVMHLNREMTRGIDYELALIPDERLYEDIMRPESLTGETHPKPSILGVDVHATDQGDEEVEKIREVLRAQNMMHQMPEIYEGHFRLQLSALIPDAWIELWDEVEAPANMWRGNTVPWAGRGPALDDDGEPLDFINTVLKPPGSNSQPGQLLENDPP